MSRRSAHAQWLLDEIDQCEEAGIASILDEAARSGSADEDGDLSRMAAGYIAAGLIADRREHLA